MDRATCVACTSPWGTSRAARDISETDTRKHRARAAVLVVGDDFQHDLGFVRRRGVATIFGRHARAVRPANTASVVREYTFGIQGESTHDERYTTSLT